MEVLQMRCSLISVIFTNVAFLAIVSFAPVRVVAQERPDPNRKPAESAPMAADGHPDLSGVWWSGPGGGAGGLTIVASDHGRTAATSLGPQPNGFGMLYKPDFMAKAKTMGDKDDPGLQCIPSPGIEGVIQILQSPAFVAILIEEGNHFRLVPMQPGRKHQEDAPPSYKGDSVGHWEGDTLVVEVTNFNDRSWIGNHGDVSFHSTSLRAVERFRRISANALEYEVTYEDPVTLTGPYKQPKRTLVLAPFDQIMEIMCLGDSQSQIIQNLMDNASKDNYGRK